MKNVLRASELLRRAEVWKVAESRLWDPENLRGRLIELSSDYSTGCLTPAMDLVLRMQCAGEPVAWVTAEDSLFYPPDAAANGVDLESLVIVVVNVGKKASAVCRAAERLVRSGSFGLVVLDLASPVFASRRSFLPMSVQGRLLQMAERHGSTILFLTEKSAEWESIGSVISLRVHASRAALSEDAHAWTLEALKDKRRPPRWRHREIVRGPDGASGRHSLP